MENVQFTPFDAYQLMQKPRINIWPVVIILGLLILFFIFLYFFGKKKQETDRQLLQQRA